MQCKGYLGNRYIQCRGGNKNIYKREKIRGNSNYPAGERLVRIANITNNKWRCAGRTGVGAVLGAKNVKGIAFYGNKKRNVADHEAILHFRNEWKKRSKTILHQGLIKG